MSSGARTAADPGNSSKDYGVIRTQANGGVSIVGHTDAKGSDGYNQVATGS